LQFVRQVNRGQNGLPLQQTGHVIDGPFVIAYHRASAGW
jgi:hypothetical protein